MITIVVPAYNEEKTLGQALLSLKQQKIDHMYEVVVVDNNSTDQTTAIATQHGCRVVHEKQQGITWARRKGVHAAKGSIIAQFDADCIAPTEWLRNITQPFFEDPDVIFTHGVSTSLQKISRVASTLQSSTF